MDVIKPEDIESLIEIFDASDWRELSLEIQGLRIFLSKDPSAAGSRTVIESRTTPAAPPSAPAAARASADGDRGPSSEAPPHEGCVAVRAPNLGIFYRRPKPEAQPFVELGDEVDLETEVAVIEVMKLFSVMRAGVRGTVRQIVAKDAEMVEYGQVLFWIDPRA